MKITWEQLANEYLDAAEASLFTRYREADYERMAVWVKTEYSLPSPEQWTSHCKATQAQQIRRAINRLRAKHYRMLEAAVEREIEIEKCNNGDD